MTDNLPARRPDCPQHGPMELRPGHTPEQRWTGTWYACSTSRCLNAALIPSRALTTQLTTQAAA
jgi:hypothetical protein